MENTPETPPVAAQNEQEQQHPSKRLSTALSILFGAATIAGLGLTAIGGARLGEASVDTSSSKFKVNLQYAMGAVELGGGALLSALSSTLLRDSLQARKKNQPTNERKP